MSELKYGSTTLNPVIQINPIDDTQATATNVYSASKIEEINKDFNIKTYTSIKSELGFTGWSDITSWDVLYNAMPNNSVFSVSLNTDSRDTLYANGLIPEKVLGYVVVNKNTTRGLVQFVTADKTWYSYYNSTFNGWVEVITENNISNPNLLDNPWFTVNQRGKSSYTTEGYSVDRWIVRNGTVNKQTNGIDIAWDGSTETHARFEQMLDFYTDLIGKTVTLSIIYDNVLYSHTFTNVQNNIQNSFDFGNGLIIGLNFESGWGNTARPIQILSKSTSAKVIKAVKLELGSVSTLVNDVAPNYATELLKCQRYFLAIPRYIRWRMLSYNANTIGFVINTPIQMRGTPTFLNPSTLIVSNLDGSNTGKAFTYTCVLSNQAPTGLLVRAALDGHGVTDCCLFVSGDTLWISSEL